jgi:hypothetical protein
LFGELFPIHREQQTATHCHFHSAPNFFSCGVGNVVIRGDSIKRNGHIRVKFSASKNIDEKSALILPPFYGKRISEET